MNAMMIPTTETATYPALVPSSAPASICLTDGIQIQRLDGGRRHSLTVAGGATSYGVLMPVVSPDVDGSSSFPSLLITASDRQVDLDLVEDALLVLLPQAAFEHLSGRWQLRAAPITDERRTVADDPTLRHLCLALLGRPHAGSGGSAVFERSLCSAMLAHFLKHYCPVSQPHASGPGILLEPWQLRIAEEVMLANIDQPLRIKAVASRCGVSVVHFSRAFRRTTSETPCRWMMRRRIERACGMLVDTVETIADIALACGFSDQSHLTRTFSTVLGTTPGAWRALQRSAQET